MILTQKQEAMHERHMEEQDRRTEQMRADRNKQVQSDKRQTARFFAKTYLEWLKRDALATLVQQNVLLDPLTADLHYKLEPYLFHCAQQTLDSTVETASLVDRTVMRITASRCQKHKASIYREMQRREEVLRLEKQEKIRIQEETKERKKRR